MEDFCSTRMALVPNSLHTHEKLYVYVCKCAIEKTRSCDAKKARSHLNAQKKHAIIVSHWMCFFHRYFFRNFYVTRSIFSCSVSFLTLHYTLWLLPYRLLLSAPCYNHQVHFHHFCSPCRRLLPSCPHAHEP